MLIARVQTTDATLHFILVVEALHLIRMLVLYFFRLELFVDKAV